MGRQELEVRWGRSALALAQWASEAALWEGSHGGGRGSTTPSCLHPSYPQRPLRSCRGRGARQVAQGLEVVWGEALGEQLGMGSAAVWEWSLGMLSWACCSLDLLSDSRNPAAR